MEKPSRSTGAMSYIETIAPGKQGINSPYAAAGTRRRSVAFFELFESPEQFVERFSVNAEVGGCELVERFTEVR